MPTFATPVGQPVAAPPPIVAPPVGNLQAAPVYSDVPAAPLVPAPAAGSSWNPFTPALVNQPVVTVPSGAAPVPVMIPAPPGTAVPATVPVPTAGVATPLGAAVPVGRDYLRITPDRILAPVGSEVVLKAGICSAQGFLVANQRVEWLLSPSGTGQFVDLGERDQVTLFRPIWDTPTKFDNSYAITSTSFMPVCLDRGTPEPTDDVQILKGDAWITVTSATEGASHVTAFTPAISDWNLHRAIATIFWVDAQWALPPSAVVDGGRPHVLTTTVSQRTDGAPLVGWLVRYDVGGGASLGYEGGNVVEVPTDAAGRASAEVSPANAGGGTTMVSITIIRPPQAGTDSSPRLEIGRGAASITWTTGISAPPAGASPFAPTPAPMVSSPFSPAPAPSVPGSSLDSTPRPTLPNTSAPAGGYTPPPDAPPPGQARLDLQLRRESAEQVAVGEFASFQVTVTNVGNGLRATLNFAFVSTAGCDTQKLSRANTK